MNRAKPIIHVVSAGGTIAGTGVSATEFTYESVELSAADLVAAVEGLDRDVEIRADTLFTIGSQDLGPVQWLKLAQHVQVLAARADVDGIVVTHGTDTLEEAAFFLDLVCRTEKPLVLTGAMRPATALSADGPRNLYQAVVAASAPQLRGGGVMVVINGLLLPGWQVVKANSIALDAFRAYPGGPAGRFMGGTLILTETPRPAPLAGAFHGHLAKSADFPLVGIAYVQGGCGDAPIRVWHESKCKGLVIAAFGAGTMSQPIADAARDLAAEGCVVVVSSRVGEVAVHVESMTGRGRGGLLPSGFLNPQKSATLLGFALAGGQQAPEVGQLFDLFSAHPHGIAYEAAS